VANPLLVISNVPQQLNHHAGHIPPAIEDTGRLDKIIQPVEVAARAPHLLPTFTIRLVHHILFWLASGPLLVNSAETVDGARGG
jgi:hypothetical protein